MSLASYDLSGRVAVVTGGATGIGAAIRSALERAGASVAVWDIAPPENAAFQARVDISDRASVEHATRRTEDALGKIDILVNNAGYAGATGPLESYDPAEWDRIIGINLTGTFNVCRAVVPILRKNCWGRVVNVASLAGKEGTANAAAYSAAKAGMIAMTKSLGKELAGSGILANAIAPAAVRTGLLDQMSPEHVAIMIGKSPMQRLGEPEEVAELVLWLCSDSCSFSTGAIFDLSGGRATY
ncbi:SDR family NAD(P)-dependent oxidoreductase [Aquamicrobium sp. LC103]|uniref:SDR family NAD(P)-dependent oxidoreductase n=1 Tax=Aquamicrobium sp. LC103 TaxID=1120658 RepID=UPI00063E75D5|nr:SDR family NAD(P)-dependent oxidoreductase [Aquamicrobium sp. LC103]TKT74769.1 SDR family oxidoreductase [Aquamicrobium sp. LC103]